MQSTTRTLTLDNGLRVNLIHQPGVDKASALIQFTVGSHDEPPEWPGLAHLLEHLLFAGSRSFTIQESLLLWAPQKGGQSNATTRLRQSAYFFEVPCTLFDDGLQRLKDMLLYPLLTFSAIKQEISVIDAENRMLQQHALSRQEAAVLHSAVAPDSFRRFHIGSAAHFCRELSEVRDAIVQFHQRYYTSANAQLWLQGPGSLDELETYARQFGSGWIQGRPNVVIENIQLSHFSTLQLENSSASAFWYCPLISLKTPEQYNSMALLRAFLLDEAPGGLLDTLRKRGFVEDLKLQWLYQDAENGWLALIFTTSSPAEVNTLLAHWLNSLRMTSAEQQQHYYQLAKRNFASLPPLERLKQCAFGFAPLGSFSSFHDICMQLLNGTVARLICSPQPVMQCVRTQGFDLRLMPLQSMPLTSEKAIFTFYPKQYNKAPPALPANIAPMPLVWHIGDTKNITLLVRPALRNNLRPEYNEGLRQVLQPLFAILQHRGGYGEWRPIHGTWQLNLQFPESTATSLIEEFLSAILPQLANPPAAHFLSKESIAIRSLLEKLPQRLTVSTQPSWIAAMDGGNDTQFQLVSRYLGLLHARTHTENDITMSVSATSHNIPRPTVKSDDKALLLFIPLPEHSSLTALRALALLYEPRFFQWLRSEMQIGYIIRCCYTRSVDQDGLLFILQSPILSITELLQLCQNFLQNFPLPGPHMLPQLKAELTGLLNINLSPAEQALTALRKAMGLSEMTPATIERLAYAEVVSLHKSLLNERNHWEILSNQPGTYK